MRNLTEQDLIQLKKEICLFEKGFYDEEINIWLGSFDIEQINQLQRAVSWTLYSNRNVELRQIWFKIKFPKYFKIGVGYVSLKKMLKQGKELLQYDSE